MDLPVKGKPSEENPWVNNTKTNKKENNNILYNNTQSNPIQNHIEYVIDCVTKNTTKVNNIKQYMLTAIFNAPNTIGSYFTTRVNHELYG